jgi:alanine racemase
MRIGDALVPVIGRVCMNQLLIDVTGVPDIHPGSTVTVLDNDYNSPCGAYALSDLAGTIVHEIITSVREHVDRIVH